MTRLAASVASVMALSSLAVGSVGGSETPIAPPSAAGALRPTADASGVLCALSDGGFEWLSGPAALCALRHPDREPAPDVEIRGTCASDPAGLAWDLALQRSGAPAGHDVEIELPILTEDRSIFTPSEHGEMDVRSYPAWTPVEYGHVGWGDGRYWVLPLVSVLDRSAGRGLTVALPPDRPIPHLGVSWSDGRVLRLRLGNRGLGDGMPASARILLLPHAADWRDALRAYAERFPAFFRPALPRGPHEGAFWYHHIHDHPDLEEMARQDVRFLWASFWFTHLGEYLPDEAEWSPYTFARWWKLGETMTDAKIRAFVAKLRDRGIGTFAYFNLTEYGGAGGAAGDEEAAARILRERFADALILDAAGRPIPTWEGAYAMNCAPRLPLFPVLRDQVERHLRRLPEIDGFCIDRLDWASVLDHGHADGFTMVGDRAAEPLAGPVALGVAEVCRLAHGAGKRVYVNQFWRVEVLRDVDGYCHEYDYPRGLGYLAPYRPASAWSHEKPYTGDLLAFEAQLKQRLQFAVFPQMVAREFPISQQAPDPEAADLLEAFAPLFSALRGKEQVLLPGCVEVDGSNDANLFALPGGRWAAPITSRVRFVSRGGATAETIRLRVRAPGADSARWAHAYSADGPTRRCEVAIRDGAAEVSVPHATSSVVVLGPPPEPAIEGPLTASAAAARDRVAARHVHTVPATEPAGPPEAEGGARILIVRGEHVGARGIVEVAAGGSALGILRDASGRWEVPAAAGGFPSRVELRTADDGTWFVPERVDLLAVLPGTSCRAIGRWRPGDSIVAGTARRSILELRRVPPVEVALPSAAFQGRDTGRAGAWRDAYGAMAAWIAGAGAPESAGGLRLRPVAGREFTWVAATIDPRALEPRPPAARDAARPSGCWFEDSRLVLALEAPEGTEYRLTVYIVDHDRNGRAARARLRGEVDESEWQPVTRDEAAAGVYLTWKVRGPVEVDVEKVEGFNVVLSGVFVDP